MKRIILSVIAAFTLFNTGSQAADQAVATGLPHGVIVMWSGTLDAIPDGWAVCDGSDGTPDLRNRFVMGVGAAEYQGSTGGAQSHSHQTRGHDHQIDMPPVRMQPLRGYSGYGYGSRNANSGYYMFPAETYNIRPFRSGKAEVTPEPASNLPPYYKIAFIMKL